MPAPTQNSQKPTLWDFVIRTTSEEGQLLNCNCQKELINLDKFIQEKKGNDEFKGKRRFCFTMTKLRLSEEFIVARG